MIGNEAPFSHLRPATSPEMLDRAYGVALRFSPLLLGAAFLFSAEHLVSMSMGTDPDSDLNSSREVAAVLATVLVGEYAATVALLAIFQGLIFPLRPLSPKALARTGLRKLPGYLLTHLMYVFALAFAFAISWGFFTARQELGSTYVSTAAGILAALAGLYVAIRLSVAPIACLIEDGGPIRSFGRSWHLTAVRPRTFEYPADRPVLRWFTVAALPALIVAIIIALFATISLYRYRVHLLSGTPATERLMDLLWFTSTLLATPLYWAGLMAFYVEYRMRHEALDYYLRIRELRRKDGDAETVA